MAIVRGDRIGESQSLNRCSIETQNFYALFISACPDDFGRYRHSPTHVAIAMYPRREATESVTKKVKRLLAELAREGLVSIWELDGVTFGQIARWKPTGNRYHRTPEPPHSALAKTPSDTARHGHSGPCLATAINQARKWGMPQEAERLSLLMKEIRERSATQPPPSHPPKPDPNTPTEADSPSSPSVPFFPRQRQEIEAGATDDTVAIDRDAWVSEGQALIREIAPEGGRLDPQEVLHTASEWKGSSYIRLDTMPPNNKRLIHTVIALRKWARRLRGESESMAPAARASPFETPSGKPGVAAVQAQGLELWRNGRDAARQIGRGSVREGDAEALALPAVTRAEPEPR